MKFSFILIASLTLLTVFSFGQESGFLQGYIVTNSNDTIQGYIKYINQVPYRVLPNIKFREDKGGKAKNYKPTELIGYNAGGKTFQTMNVGDVPGGQFMELVINGPLKLYQYRVTAMGVPEYGPGTSSSYYLQKSNSKILFDIGRGNFKERVGEYLSDVKEISDKVKSGVLKRVDIETIVKEYNKLKQE